MLTYSDECHRGSPGEESSWHEMLEYFSPATQIGLTAIPKETAFGSNIEYFGEPIYNYSLKQGMLGHDIYSELLFLARSTKMMENDVKNLSTLELKTWMCRSGI